MIRIAGPARRSSRCTPCWRGLVMTATGVGAPMALLAVAHAALAVALVLLAAYVRERCPGAPRSFRWHVLAAFALFPTTFFARECYSESVFVLLSLLVFYGLGRKSALAVIASIVGLATAARSVGVALCVPLVFDAWRREGFFLGLGSEAGAGNAPGRLGFGGLCRVPWACLRRASGLRQDAIALVVSSAGKLG